MNCPSCEGVTDPSSRTCTRCGQALLTAIGSLVANRYEILAHLGEGGMGTVLKAHDRSLDAVVALKLVHLGRDPKAVGRFHHEVKLARRVKHPNVCSVYEYGEDGDIVFCAMELVEG